MIYDHKWNGAEKFLVLSLSFPKLSLSVFRNNDSPQKALVSFLCHYLDIFSKNFPSTAFRQLQVL